MTAPRSGWRKSSRCEAQNCVWVLVEPGGFRRIRTGQQQSTILASEDEWRGFVAAVKRGEFDVDQPARGRRWSRRQLVGGVVRAPRSARIGRTAGWPASLHWTRYGYRRGRRGRISGISVRVGDRIAYCAVMPQVRPHDEGVPAAPTSPLRPGGGQAEHVAGTPRPSGVAT